MKRTKETSLLPNEAITWNFYENICQNTPFPIGYLYRQMLILKEEGNLTPFDILRLSHIILKYFASILISDWIKEGNKEKRVVNSLILKYFKTPSLSIAQATIKIILKENPFKDTQFFSSNFRLFLKPPILSPLLPDFVNLENKTLLDLFDYFVNLQNKLDTEKFSFINIPQNEYIGYVNLIGYILHQLMPLFEPHLGVVMAGSTQNFILSRGTALSSSKYDFKKKFVLKNHQKAFILKDKKDYLPLHPFIVIKQDENHQNRGKVFFLHKVDVGKVIYVDYVNHRLVDAQTLGRGLYEDVINLFKVLKYGAPIEKIHSTSPIINFDDFIEFHTRTYIDRPALRKEVDGFIASTHRYYGIITGEKGRGKTSFICEFINRRRDSSLVYHFVRKVNKTDDPIVFLRSLGGQLMKIEGIFEEEMMDLLTEDISLLREMFHKHLESASKVCSKRGERLILLIDGIDEAENPETLLSLLPHPLPENCVGILTFEVQEAEKKPKINLSSFEPGLRYFKNCPLPPFSKEEMEQYLKAKGIKENITPSLRENIHTATLKGEPLITSLFANSIKSLQISMQDLLPLLPYPQQVENIKQLAEDSYYRQKILFPLYLPIPSNTKEYWYSSFELLGMLTILNHPIGDEDFASMMRWDLWKTKYIRSLTNKFTLNEKGEITFYHPFFKDVFSSLFTNRDYVRLHRRIINFYEVTSEVEGEIRRNSKALSRNALRFLPYHYYELGKLTGDFQGLWDLEQDDNFRTEQGLRVGVKSILEGLKLATESAIEKNNIDALIKFGFLYSDVKSGGIKGGLSMIVSQAMEGNFREALDLARKIPDDAFRYKQLLFIAWLLGRSNEYLKVLDVLEEALMISGATFKEEDENLIFEIVKTLISMGIGEALDILKTGIEEERVIRYYSRLADILKGHPSLILKLVTGASIQLRKTSNEKIKGKFLLEFTRIALGLDDEIKKRQFIENFIYEAKNIEDEKVRYEILADISHIIASTYQERAIELFKEAIEELQDNSATNLSLSAYIAGKMAATGFIEDATEIFKRCVEATSHIYSSEERAKVLETLSRSTVNIEDPNLRANILELIFMEAEKLDDAMHQTQVMVGISETLGFSDADAELLNVYSTTYSYIDEMPVDIAADYMVRILRNVGILRDKPSYESVWTSFVALIRDLDIPDKTGKLIEAFAEGISSSPYLEIKEVSNYINQIIEYVDFIDIENAAPIYTKTLVGMANSILTNIKSNEKLPLIFALIKKAEVLKEKHRWKIYSTIAEKIHLLQDKETIESLFTTLEEQILQIDSIPLKAECFISFSKGLPKIKQRAIREKLIERLMYLADTLEDGNEAYRVLSSLCGSLLSAGEEQKGVSTYEKALSKIPLKEEKSPEALGGVMAGLCRGLTIFAHEEWVQNIYKRLVNRLDFIAPERKKLEVLQGIAESMSYLEDRKLLLEYYHHISEVADTFTNPKEKTISFLTLARAYEEISEMDKSRKMWERVISMATALESEEDGKLKAEILSEGAISIWKFEGEDWQNQAFSMIIKSASSMSLQYKKIFLQNTFKNIKNLKYANFQDKVVTGCLSLLSDLENPEDIIEGIEAISVGISSLEKSLLLKDILNRLVKVVEGIKQGTNRVRAMAIISANFLQIGMDDWAKKAFAKIEKAYERLKDSKIKCMILGEMIRIPFFSNNFSWQEEIVNRVLTKELPQFQDRWKANLLKALVEILPLSKKKEWWKEKISHILKEAEAMREDYMTDLFKALLKTLAELGDMEAIFNISSQVKSKITFRKITSHYLAEALENSIDTDVVKSINFYWNENLVEARDKLFKKAFKRFMESQREFDEEAQHKYYVSFLRFAVENRETLDFAIGEIVSRYRDKDKLKDLATYLGLYEYKRKKAEEITPVTVSPAEVPTPPKVEGEEEEGAAFELRILPSRREKEEVKAMDLSGSIQEEEADVTFIAEKKAPERKGLLHKWQKGALKPSDVLSLEKGGDISDLLKDGYRLVKGQYFREAMKIFEKVVEEFPEDPRGLIGIAATYYMLTDYKKAAEYYIEAKKVKPDVDIMEKFLKEVPKNTYIWYDFAKNLYALGDIEETLRFCDKIKAEGVYFDFVKRVDHLRDMCLEAKIEKTKPYTKKYAKYGIHIGVALLILLIITQSASWVWFFVGLLNMRSGYKQKDMLLQGTQVKSIVTYKRYSKPFKDAVSSFEKVHPNILFWKGMYENTILKEAICLYEISHYVRLYRLIPRGDSPKGKHLIECFKYRKKALETLKPLIDESSYQSMYYAGLIHLDNALGPHSKGVSKKISFNKAIENLRNSIHYSSNKASLDQYIALAEAYIEYYRAYPSRKTQVFMDEATPLLKKALRMKKDPRIYVYQVMAYSYDKQYEQAQIAYQKAEKLIEIKYKKYPKVKDYWLQKLNDFAKSIPEEYQKSKSKQN